MLNLQKTYVLLTLAMGLTLGVLTGCSNAPTTETSVTVFADDPTYQSRTELEAPWYGTLRAAQRTIQGNGPYYTVVYGQDAQAIYTGEVIPQLESFVGQEVVVRGKVFSSDTTASSPALWPATVKQNEARLVECIVDGELQRPEEKIASSLRALIEESPEETREEVIVGFCDDIEITPESTKEEVERLREPLYAMLEEELEPYGVEIMQTFWLTGGMIVEMPLGAVHALAERPDTIYFSLANERFPPP